jgi:hypothetical protein
LTEGGAREGSAKKVYGGILLNRSNEKEVGLRTTSSPGSIGNMYIVPTVSELTDYLLMRSIIHSQDDQNVTKKGFLASPYLILRTDARNSWKIILFSLSSSSRISTVSFLNAITRRREPRNLFFLYQSHYFIEELY